METNNENLKVCEKCGVQCCLWDKNTGCPLPFEKRPKGARALIPKSIPNTNVPGKCIDGYTKSMCVRDWRPYYVTLAQLAAFFFPVR